VGRDRAVEGLWRKCCDQLGAKFLKIHSSSILAREDICDQRIERTGQKGYRHEISQRRRKFEPVPFLRIGLGSGKAGAF
jgi:hypothetical protein